MRVPDPLWDRFGEVAEQCGTTRSAVLQDFIRRYIDDPAVAAGSGERSDAEADDRRNTDDGGER